MVRGGVLLASCLLCVCLVVSMTPDRLNRGRKLRLPPPLSISPSISLISQSPPHSYMWALDLASVVADPRTALHEYFPRGRFAAPPQRASLLADPFTLDDFLVRVLERGEYALV